MLLFQENVDLRSSQVWITPTSAPRTAADDGPVSPQGNDRARVLLVDEPQRFREQAVAELAARDLEVLQASGADEAVRLARAYKIDLLVIGGDQHYPSAWRCAGKLCGRSPWLGVILYFDHVSARDRLWGRVSQLTALVETKDRPEPLVRPVLRALGRSLSADVQ